MNKTATLICTLFILPTGLCMAQDKFSISGKLPKAAAHQMVVLSYVNSEGKNANDTTLLESGKFAFAGTTAYGNRASLSVRPVVTDTTKKRAAYDYQQFYLEKGNYKVVGVDSVSKVKITGTKAQSDYLVYESKMGGLLQQWRDLNSRAMKVYNKDSIAFKAIQTEAKPLHATMEATLDSFIFSHPDSYVTVDLVHDNKTSVIDAATFDRYYTALSARVMNSFTGKKITAKYDKAKQTAVGKAFDFTQEDAQGKSFTLSSLHGKYVLIDFWASWCGPCRAENPNLLKAYQQLKEKNFEIVGISLDDSKAAWLKAVEKDGMPWIQVSDLKGWKNEVAVRYGVTAIPQNMLVDPKGVIVAKNLRGEGLTEKLSEYVK